MRWKPIEPIEKVFEGSDAYFQWRRGAGAEGRYDLERPVLVRLKNGVTARQFAEGTAGTGAWKPHVRVPEFYTHPLSELERAQWCTARADPGFFGLLTTDDELPSLISRIAALPPMVPQLDDYEAAIGEDSNAPFRYPAPETVVIGIIDYGIAFAHERFRSSELESRIEYMWVQDAPLGRSQTPGLGEGPQSGFEHGSAEGSQLSEKQPVPYGREITGGNINFLLQNSARGGSVDEDTLYRQGAVRLGRNWLRSVSRRAAHGTHVMGLACGHDLDDQEREHRPIICVQLPEAATADTSGENLDAYALDGIRYILDRADEIARRVPNRKYLPVVINFSYGNVAGPHDGTSDLELAVDELIRMRRKTKFPLEIVLPSGNSHLARLHAQVAFEKQGETVHLHWRVMPDDRTPSFMEIWLPGEPASSREARVELQVTTPGGLKSDPLDDTNPGEGLRLWSPKDEVLCEMRYRCINHPTNRGMFLIALQPTRQGEQAPQGGATPVAPSGTWIVTLVNRRLQKREPVEAWIQRDDTPYGFRRRGRQSYFDERCYKRFFDAECYERLGPTKHPQGREIEEDSDQPPCHVKRAGSINAIATGRETIVVGGFLEEKELPAEYSAGGPITRVAASDLHRHGPDVMAVSDASVVRRGVLGAGTRSGSVVALNGTSVAAPQITRVIADELAASRPGDRAAVAKLAQQHESKPGAFATATPRKERAGSGRIKRPPGDSIKRGRAADENES
jgi:hypothetical protein